MGDADSGALENGAKSTYVVKMACFCLVYVCVCLCVCVCVCGCVGVWVGVCVFCSSDEDA